jgi:hypothetical protein
MQSEDQMMQGTPTFTMDKSWTASKDLVANFVAIPNTSIVVYQLLALAKPSIT